MENARADDLSDSTQLSSMSHPSQPGALGQSHARVFGDVFPLNEGQAEILAHLPTALF